MEIAGDQEPHTAYPGTPLPGRETNGCGVEASLTSLPLPPCTLSHTHSCRYLHSRVPSARAHTHRHTLTHTVPTKAQQIKHSSGVTLSGLNVR